MNLICDPWFRLSIGRRADLSGRPLGLLFIWRPQQVVAHERKWLSACRWQFGFYLPRLRASSGELVQFSDKPASHDWRQWPEGHRKACEAATSRYLSETAKRRECGMLRIVRDFSRCDRRIDLAEIPWQLYREICAIP